MLDDLEGGLCWKMQLEMGNHTELTERYWEWRFSCNERKGKWDLYSAYRQ